MATKSAEGRPLSGPARIRELYPKILEELQRLDVLSGWEAPEEPDDDAGVYYGRDGRIQDSDRLRGSWGAELARWINPPSKDRLAEGDGPAGAQTGQGQGLGKILDGSNVTYRGSRSDDAQATQAGDGSPPSVRPSISVAEETPAPSVLGDITRLLMPEYSKLLLQFMLRAEESLRDDDEERAGFALLQAKTRAKAWGGHNETVSALHIPGTEADESNADIESCGSGRVKISAWVSYADAVRMLNAGFPNG